MLAGLGGGLGGAILLLIIILITVMLTRRANNARKDSSKKSPEPTRERVAGSVALQRNLQSLVAKEEHDYMSIPTRATAWPGMPLVQVDLLYHGTSL